MIPNDVVFLQPATIAEALAAWREASESGLRVHYFGGGTELVTGARERNGEFDVLVDLKRIPELCEFDPSARRFGAGLRLSRLADQRAVPLLARAAAGVADRTARNSITFGGNLCSRLPYRETVIPLLVFDATFTIASPDGSRTTGARELCAKRLQLAPGEFVVGVELPAAAAQAGAYRRRTSGPRVDYPLVTLCAAKVDGELRFAVGGAYGYPVRSAAAEAVIATGDRRPLGLRARAEAVLDAGAARESDTIHRARAEAAVDAIVDRFWSDMRGSSEYRRELLVLALTDAIAELEDA